MGDRDLRASLRQIGPQIPGLEYAGELVDGRKKALMCAELRVPFPVQRAETLKEACSILWTRHPARALELAGTTRVLELAELCSTSAVSIAKELQANKPKRPRKPMRIIQDVPYPALKDEKKMVRRLFVLEPELYAYAQEAAAQKGHRNVNRLVRDALWKEIALIVPSAPQFQPRRVEPPSGLRKNQPGRPRRVG
jgi:hypothetical protein